jgi:hypothetical protein
VPKTTPATRNRSAVLASWIRSSAILGCVLGAGPIVGAPALGAVESARLDAPVEGMTLKIVAGDKTPLRSGDQDNFYVIAELASSTPVQTGGVSGAYTMILLPDTIGALVPVGEISSGSDGSTVTLSVASKLRAPSQLLGIAGAWKSVYTDPLPVGTELEVIETLKSGAGDVLGYRVVAPKSPLGELPIAYIRSDALRDPTPEELKGLRSTKTAPVTELEPDSGSEPTSEPTSDDAPEEQVDTSLMEELVPATTYPDETGSDPVEIENTTPTDIEPTETQNEAPAHKSVSNGQISSAELEDLEAAFDQARSLSRTELDEALGELKAEFTRTRVQADDGSSLARALDQRLEWIAIRIESRDQRRAIAAALAASDSKLAQLNADIEAWQRGRAYQLVGRMETSSVYTGEHLPLLYRIRTVDPATGAAQTIGYVAPRTDQDFRHLLGRIVGVIGSSTDDQSLMLSVIEPDRIDPMPE